MSFVLHRSRCRKKTRMYAFHPRNHSSMHQTSLEDTDANYVEKSVKPPTPTLIQAISAVANHNTMTRHSAFTAYKAHFARTSHFGAESGPSPPMGMMRSNIGARTLLPTTTRVKSQIRSTASRQAVRTGYPVSDLQEPISRLRLLTPYRRLTYIPNAQWTLFVVTRANHRLVLFCFPNWKSSRNSVVSC
jgi:hypothetical protein